MKIQLDDWGKEEWIEKHEDSGGWLDQEGDTFSFDSWDAEGLVGAKWVQWKEPKKIYIHTYWRYWSDAIEQRESRRTKLTWKEMMKLCAGKYKLIETEEVQDEN